MAASMSRPDPSSPASVAEAAFSTSRRGFNQDEVRAFLTSVAAELGRLQERERRLDAELRDLRAAEPAEVELDEETVAHLLGEETLRVLHTARESASEIKIRAEETAARILREANDEANRLRQEAEVEAARKRQDAGSEAEAEVALAKQQGREMVNEARAYRERVLADLDRRTTLARQQIEELIHGRDRLLQVFERARLVAVDVTSELGAVDGPDELVNLAPTTGPVPVMVPHERRSARADEHAEEAGPAGDDAGEDTADDTAPPDTAATDDEASSEDAAAAEPTDDGARADDAAAAEPTDDGARADDAAAAEPTDDADDADDTHDTDVADEPDGTGETDATDDTGEETAAAPGGGATADGNVVSLFGDRSPPESARDDADDSDEADDVDDTHEAGADRPDVGGIFERLRQEVPAARAAADSSATADTSADVETDAAPVDDAAADDAAADDAAEPTPFSRRDEALVPLIVAGARKIKRALADEQNGALDTLRQREPVTSLHGLLPGVDEQTAGYVAALEEELIGAAAAGAVEVGAADNRALRRSLAKTGALDGAHALVRTDLVSPLRDRLERAISEGAGDNEAITKRVRAVYREWKTQHIDDQLDDVFRSAHGGGTAVSVEPGTPLVWTIDPSEPSCPDCEDNSLAGPVAAGEPFPTGHTAAPAHPGCRCLTVPAAR